MIVTGNNMSNLERLSQEEYERQRAQLRSRSFVDFSSSIEFAQLPADMQAQMAEQVDDEDTFTVSAGTAGRGDVFSRMFTRANPWSFSNAVSDARLRGSDSHYDVGYVGGQGMIRGPISNNARSEERAEYTPSPEDLLEAADRYGVTPTEANLRRMAGWSSSREDLDRVAEGIGSMTIQDALIADSVGPVDGFLMDFAANALRPEFLALGAGAGKALQLGTSMTRTGSAIRYSLAAGATDVPIETARMLDNPNYGPAQAAIAITISMGLGAAFGAAGNNLLRPEEVADVDRLMAEHIRTSRWLGVDVDPMYMQELRDLAPTTDSVNAATVSYTSTSAAGDIAAPRALDGSSSVGAASVFSLSRDLEARWGPIDGDAPERMVLGLGLNPVSYLARQEDPLSRQLAATLVQHPAWGTTGSTMFEVAERVTAGGGFFSRQADDAMRAFYKDIDELPANSGVVERLTRPIARHTGGTTDAQATEFFETVGRVIHGWEVSDNVHVNRAADAIRDGVEDSLYYLQDSNYTGWNPQRSSPPERTGRSVPEAADLAVDRSYLPRRPSETGWRSVVSSFLPNIRSADNATRNKEALTRIGDRLGQVLLRNDDNIKWLEGLAERWNARRLGPDGQMRPDATGRVAPPMTAERMAQRIMRRYAQTWDRIATGREGPDIQSRPMSEADRDAVREIVRREFGDQDETLDAVTEELMDAVLDLIAPARRRTTADSPRLMNRLRLDFRSAEDGDIIKMFETDASVLFRDYRRHVAGRHALLRHGFDGPGDFLKKVDEIAERAAGMGGNAQKRAERTQRLLRDGLGAVTGEPRHMAFSGPGFQKAKFWTQGLMRNNYAALLINTTLGPMFAEYGSMLFRAHHRLLARTPGYNAYLKAARKGDLAGMRGGFMIADVTAGHGSSLVRARGSSRTRYDGDAPEVAAGTGRLERGFDEFTRKNANMSNRISGMSAASDLMRSIHMVTDLENWAQGRLTRFQRQQAGLTEDMWARIQAILKDTPTVRSDATGRELIDDAALMARATADDPEAWNAMIDAMNRRARTVVQEPDWGHQPLWTRIPGIDIMYQFMAYPVTAATKQAVPFAMAIAQRDPDALRVLIGSMSAGLGYVNRVYMQSLAMDDPAGYREERLTTASIGKAMFYYSTVGSLAPNIYDGVATMTGAFDPAFSGTRASGLDASPLTGNPTYSQFQSGRRAILDIFDGQFFSEQDAEGLIRSTPGLQGIARFIPVQIALNQVLEVLPDEPGED